MTTESRTGRRRRAVPTTYDNRPVNPRDFIPAPARPSHAAPVYPADLPERGEAIQALTRDVLIRRSLDVSPTAFITIISIIQGVALGLLAQNTFARPGLLVGVQSFAMLMVLVSVFYYYLTMSILLRWAPSFLDCFLPFAIASLEIPGAFFLGNARAWNLWLGAFWFGTFIGLWITKKWSPPSHFGDEIDAHRTLHDLLHELRLTAGLGAMTVGWCGLFAVLMPFHQLFWGLLGAGVVLATVGMVVARTELRASQIHARYGVNRPPFN
ncbi:hypothetical protein [Paractinoplanes deccanensis]|uniref:hypothetical protein n=1 Tax=Paractinoplanes deccanensis TaxID=113561 RepID=UPI001942EF0F|nr:hypothetical protein [Actinoplanes deccanensis]